MYNYKLYKTYVVGLVSVGNDGVGDIVVGTFVVGLIVVGAVLYRIKCILLDFV